LHIDPRGVVCCFDLLKKHEDKEGSRDV